MGAGEKCPFFRSLEILNMARELATVISTAPVPPAKKMLSLERDAVS
jgi:hypothetical protein